MPGIYRIVRLLGLICLSSLPKRLTLPQADKLLFEKKELFVSKCTKFNNSTVIIENDSTSLGSNPATVIFITAHFYFIYVGTRVIRNQSKGDIS